ncbi:hypothetical protein KP509_19G030900 [Ceratopteris richardii]|uniref:Protein kinase domain-containing protein n=1 Tax=Ceratopteris richardii TaxID=49495 RepID=A0A8T2SMM5_CERRI|nr:hypothetical protein KP509_19G030900 [Ceratopteris richardii]
MREIESVGSIRHRNLIRIFGYFSNQQDLDILILEYMPNGSLHDHLHSNKARESLSWEARLRVAIQVGEGLLYMHNDCPSPIIHCDLKPQNILFDANMEVRISDFGLAKMIADTASTSSFTENVRGMLGYMAPEVASSGHISRKCDVYSFGILLIELITGRKPFEEVHMQSEDGEDQSTTTLVRWVSVTLQSGGKILDIVDSEIRHACAESKEVIDQAQKLLNVAFHCTEENPNRRPEMQQVVRRVQSIAGYNTSAVEYHGDPEGPEVDGRSQAFDQ